MWRSRRPPSSESRAFTEHEALGASPPLIDLVATDVADLLRKLHGRDIRRFDGTTTRLDTAGATLVPIEMSTRQRGTQRDCPPEHCLHVAEPRHPGLTIELWSPGAILPGVVGALSLLLAFFALQLLPVNYAGLLADRPGRVDADRSKSRSTSYGLLTAGGAVSLVFGAMILIDAPEPELRLEPPIRSARRPGPRRHLRVPGQARRHRAATGAGLGNSSMIGAVGDAVTPVRPGAPDK